MRLRHVLLSGAIVATTGAIALGGSVSAGRTAVGIESFSSVQDISGNGGGPVTASGVINAHGTDTVVSATEDTFDFGAQGKITVFHSPLSNVQHVNQKQCTFSFTERGVYVFGNGTGAWANYSGSGKYTVQGSATNSCGDSPVGTVTINASGPISPLSTDN